MTGSRTKVRKLPGLTPGIAGAEAWLSQGPVIRARRPVIILANLQNFNERANFSCKNHKFAVMKQSPTSGKLTARMAVEALKAYGVTTAVVSHGSRNTPLIIALEFEESINKVTVVDERSAAFIALGIALDGYNRSPVALVCTSGTAMLNYAPAVAEAYYRGCPLVILSADRPSWRIDQNDSQTIRQYRAFDNYVKASYNVDVEGGGATDRQVLNRVFNEALARCLEPQSGPVHINIAFEEPLDTVVEAPQSKFKKIERVGRCMPGRDGVAKVVSRYRRIMVVGGFHVPDPRLKSAFKRLAAKGVVVMAEPGANCPEAITDVDGCLSVVKRLPDWPDCETMHPDAVFYFGGSPVSRLLKMYIKSLPAADVYRVGPEENLIDTFGNLCGHFRCTPADFFELLAEVFDAEISPQTGDFSSFWLRNSLEAREAIKQIAANSKWSTLKAVGQLLKCFPTESRCRLQLSNGMTVRYASMFNLSAYESVDCNRGVSGIDGSTSTAVGSAYYYDGLTLFVTGDMSALYDVGVLSWPGVSNGFRMAVIDNGGGGIFRTIKLTDNMTDLMRQKYYLGDVNLPLEKLAEAWGWGYYKAKNTDQLNDVLEAFRTHSGKAILHITTDSETDKTVYRALLRTLREPLN